MSDDELMIGRNHVRYTSVDKCVLTARIEQSGIMMDGKGALSLELAKAMMLIKGRKLCAMEPAGNA